MDTVVLSSEEKCWAMDVPASAKLLALYLIREYAKTRKWRHPRISRVAKTTGLSRSTIYRSVAILQKYKVARIGGLRNNYDRHIELDESLRY